MVAIAKHAAKVIRLSYADDLDTLLREMRSETIIGRFSPERPRMEQHVRDLETLVAKMRAEA